MAGRKAKLLRRSLLARASLTADIVEPASEAGCEATLRSAACHQCAMSWTEWKPYEPFQDCRNSKLTTDKCNHCLFANQACDPVVCGDDGVVDGLRKVLLPDSAGLHSGRHDIITFHQHRVRNCLEQLRKPSPKLNTAVVAPPHSPVVQPFRSIQMPESPSDRQPATILQTVVPLRGTAGTTPTVELSSPSSTSCSAASPSTTPATSPISETVSTLDATPDLEDREMRRAVEEVVEGVTAPLTGHVRQLEDQLRRLDTVVRTLAVTAVSKP